MSRKIVHIPQHKEVASTPSTPDSGYSKIYVKSDGLWYYLDDAGSESLLGGGGGGTWGSITGTLSDQTDLHNALDDKVDETRAINTASNSGLGGGGNLTADRSFVLNVNNLTSFTEAVSSSDTIAIYNASTGATQKATLLLAVAAAQVYQDTLEIQPFPRTTNMTVLAESVEGVTCPFDGKIGKVVYRAFTPGGRTGTTSIRLLVDGVAYNTTGVTLDVTGKGAISPATPNVVSEGSLITVEVVSIQSPAPIGLAVTIEIQRV